MKRRIHTTNGRFIPVWRRLAVRVFFFEIFVKYLAPLHTQTPNVFYDKVARTLGESELRVLLVIIRHTFGWHKEMDRISLTEIEKESGLSRPAVVSGVKGLIEKEQITCIKTNIGNEYGMRIVNEINQVNDEVVNEVNYPSKPCLLVDKEQVVNEVNTQKKENLNKRIKESLFYKTPFEDFKKFAEAEGINTSCDGWMTEYVMRQRGKS